MKRILRFLTGRIFITAVALLVQLAYFVTVLFNFVQYSATISFLSATLSILITLYLVGKEDNPSYRIAWIIVVMATPLMGGILYLLLGNKHPTKRMARKLRAPREHLLSLCPQDAPDISALSLADPRAAGRSQYLTNMGSYPVTQNTTVKYYPLGEETFAAMLSDLKSAKHFIFMEYFIINGGFMWDAILEILKEKAAQGVEVRLMYDDLGSLFYLPNDFCRTMESYGIHCLRFNPLVPFLSLVMNNRDHRKIMIIDGHTAFTGGINLSDEYINRTHPFGHWKDTCVCLHGQSVWGFTLMFLEMWHAFYKTDEDIDCFRPNAHHPAPFETDGFVQVVGDSPLDDEPVCENLYIDILNQAQNYVYIFTPYLIIDDAMFSGLTAAARRGVDVRIVTPGVPDKKMVFRLTRSYYAPLIRAGVRIYEYTPGFLHAKSIIADDSYGVVGTINLDYRSLFLHFECAAYLYQCAALTDLKQDALNTMAQSREVTLPDCNKSILGTLIDAILRMFAPLC